MNFTVCYFGLLAERRGLAEERVTSSAATPAALYTELDAAHGLGCVRSDLRAAVDDGFVPWEHPLVGGETVAFLPPMSGG